MLSFFENLGTLQKLPWIFNMLIFRFLLEAGIPLFRMQYNKWRHVGVNLVFLPTTIIINGIFGVATLGIFLWLDAHNFGSSTGSTFRCGRS